LPDSYRRTYRLTQYFCGHVLIGIVVYRAKKARHKGITSLHLVLDGFAAA